MAGYREVATAHPAKRELRRRGITHDAVAERLGLARNHVNGVLNGHRGATVEFRTGLAKMLGLPEAKLFNPLPPARPKHSPKRKAAA
jgi:transcriptional regulator with XRE-family HTH domain